MQLKTKLNKEKSKYISSDQLYDWIVSMSPRYMSMILFDMKNEQICKTINMSRHSVSLKIIEDSDYWKKSVEKKRSYFVWKVVFFMFGSCSYFLNKTLNKICSKQIRIADPAVKSSM